MKKFLQIIIEKGSNNLSDAFFAKNQAFIDFIGYFNSNKHIIKTAHKKIKQGFVGHTVSFISLLIKKNPDSLQSLKESMIIRQRLEFVY